MFSIVNLAFLWVSAMVWHMWRIITLRPAFQYLGDTAGMAISFLTLYFWAGLVRWFVLDNHATNTALTFGVLGMVVLNLTIYAVLVGFMYERSRRNSSLFASVLGLSACIDLLMSCAYLAGFSDSVRMPACVNLGLELALSLVLAWRFSQEPEDVQRNGYKRAPHKAGGQLQVTEVIDIL